VRKDKQLSRARIVRVVAPGLGKVAALVQLFHVAIDDDEAAIAAVRRSQGLSANNRVETISEMTPALVVALLLRPGQVKMAISSLT
jgi:hypothetical protein